MSTQVLLSHLQVRAESFALVRNQKPKWNKKVQVFTLDLKKVLWDQKKERASPKLLSIKGWIWDCVCVCARARTGCPGSEPNKTLTEMLENRCSPNTKCHKDLKRKKIRVVSRWRRCNVSKRKVEEILCSDSMETCFSLQWAIEHSLSLPLSLWAVFAYRYV